MSATGVVAADAGTVKLQPDSRTDSAILLDRTTEEAGIVVDEGYCDLADPNFGDAANRLACLELEDLESEASRPGSSKSLQASLRGSGSVLKSSSSRSLSGKPSGSPRSGAPRPPAKQGSLSSQLPARHSMDSIRSECADSLPPGSPFSKLEYQRTILPSMTAEEAEIRLKAKNIDKRLLSGLKSLSADELTLYMQLTEELKREGVSQPPSAAQSDQSSGSDPSRREGLSACSSAENEERLESAVRKLRSLLPKSVIEQLQSHASYGLMDVIQSQPLTPPPTPTSPSAEGSSRGAGSTV